MSDIGHNGANVGEVIGFLERIERLEEEKKEIAEQIKEVWAEAKALGHDTKALRRAASLRKLDAGDRASLGVYVDALGVFG